MGSFRYGMLSSEGSWRTFLKRKFQTDIHTTLGQNVASKLHEYTLYKAMKKKKRFIP